MSDLSERLKSIRTTHKLRQVDVAEKCGIALRSYKYYESGERKPDSDALASLSECFGVSADYFLFGIDYSATGGGIGYDLTENQGKLLEAIVRLDDDDVRVLLFVAQKLAPRPPGDGPQ
jgi:transcriptional regulator with XRE-family HTH domain